MNEQIQTVAWYRQFWPWFLIALPATVVIASILTLYIAAKDPDLIIQRSEDERIGPIIFEPSTANHEQIKH